MSGTFLEDLIFPLQVETATIRKQWYDALRKGDLKDALQLMERRFLSANFAATVTGENPLVTLAKADKNSEYYLHQATLAQILIGRGCELGIPDVYKMLPADWAMLSDNRELACIIVPATVLAFHKAGRINSYAHSIEGFFLTCNDDNERMRRFDALLRNRRNVGKVLLSAISASVETPLGNAITKAELDYWSREIEECHPDDMPFPSLALEVCQLHRKRVRDHVLLGESFRPLDEVEEPADLNTAQRIEYARAMVYHQIARATLS